MRFYVKKIYKTLCFDLSTHRKPRAQNVTSLLNPHYEVNDYFRSISHYVIINLSKVMESA